MHDRGDYNAEGVLQIAVNQNSSARVIKEMIRSDFRAEVCGDCRFLRQYASDPEELWNAYQKNRSDVE